MRKKTITTILYPILAIGITVALVGVVRAAAYDSGPVAGWAWSSNVGWINFAPPNGGVTVCDDHLEGYAWGENVGWIRLGTYTGGDAHTYGNTSAANYGVNRDLDTGALSGYAWGTNVGWIDFSPDGGGVTIDPVSGEFSGYAWGENVGWVHFSSAGPVAYRVRLLIYRVFLPQVLRDWAPTSTPIVPVYCTPPPCKFDEGEVYHCPSECPGGCGTICATVTPAP